jgi:hypothetical protein
LGSPGERRHALNALALTAQSTHALQDSPMLGAQCVGVLKQPSDCRSVAAENSAEEKILHARGPECGVEDSDCIKCVGRHCSSQRREALQTALLRVSASDKERLDDVHVVAACRRHQRSRASRCAVVDVSTSIKQLMDCSEVAAGCRSSERRVALVRRSVNL